MSILSIENNVLDEFAYLFQSSMVIPNVSRIFLWSVIFHIFQWHVKDCLFWIIFIHTYVLCVHTYNIFRYFWFEQFFSKNDARRFKSSLDSLISASINSSELACVSLSSESGPLEPTKSSCKLLFSLKLAIELTSSVSSSEKSSISIGAI